MFNFYDEYLKVKKICDDKGFECVFLDDYIYIKTNFEAWKFKPNGNGVVTLFHGNGLGKIPNGYHKQFVSKMSYRDLITYIYEHGLGKFRGFRMNYTFDKSGKRRMAM